MNESVETSIISIDSIYNGIDKEDREPVKLNAYEEQIKLFCNYFNNKNLSDLVIKVNEKKIYYAHKLILVTCSEVFNKMLCDPNWTEPSNQTQIKTQREIHLKEQEECESVFEKFLGFFYNADIIIQSDEIYGLLCLADKYNVKSLLRICIQYMHQKLKEPSLKRALEWRHLAAKFNLVDLQESCMRALAWNAERFIQTNEWLELDCDFLKLYLDDSNLIIPDELTLYRAVCKWLLAFEMEGRLENFEYNFRQLIPLIRFAQMLETQLFYIENFPLLKKDSKNSEKWLNDLIKESLHKAYRFRCLEEVIIKLNNKRKFKTDRILQMNQLRPDYETNRFDDYISFESNQTDEQLQMNRDELGFNDSEYLNTGHILEKFDKWYLPRNYTDTWMGDIIEIKSSVKVNLQLDQKLNRGPVPKPEKNADWKISYRTGPNNNLSMWIIRIICNQNALIDNSILGQVTAIIYNKDQLVVQVESKPAFDFNKQDSHLFDMPVQFDERSKRLVLLIKQVIFS